MGYYTVQQASGASNAVKKGTLTLTSGTNYTFEATGDGFLNHPLAITLSEDGPASMPETEGIVGNNPTSDDNHKLFYVPPGKGPVSYYYHSVNAAGVGGKIKIVNTCTADEHHICVYYDGKTISLQDRVYDNPEPHKAKTLTAGTNTHAYAHTCTCTHAPAPVCIICVGVIYG